MHSEPINTAARIAGLEVIEIDASNEAAYHRLLHKSSERTLRIATSRPAERTVILKKKVGRQSESSPIETKTKTALPRYQSASN
jgi:hypothetical protein